MMKLFGLIFLIFSFNLMADTEVSLMGSLNYNTPDTNNLDNIDSRSSGGGWGAGIRSLMGINDQLFFRSGASFLQKNFSYKISGGGKKGDLNFQYSYLQIPLTFYWRASPQTGFFFGSAINARLDDSCSGTQNYNPCSAKGARTLVMPAVVGFEFMLTKKVGIEISYEYALTETAKNVKVNTTVVSLLYHFDQ
jgi:hypothetical protein